MIKISEHEFSDEDVKFSFATEAGICLIFVDTDFRSENDLQGILNIDDVSVMAEHFGYKLVEVKVK